MATLRAHGMEIGRITYTDKIDAYFADGKILRNSGSGWKAYAKVKPGLTIQDAYKHQVDKQVKFLEERPFLKAYRKELHNLAGISKAWKLHAAVQLLPEDPDGVWSEVCDSYGDNVSASPEEICKLCDLYQLATRESKAIKESKSNGTPNT